MRKIVLLLSIALLAIAVQSCRKVSGRGPVVTENRDISGFKEIKSDISGEVYVTPGPAYKVSIEAQQNIIDVVETVLNDNRLTIRLKSNTVVKSADKIIVRVTSPDIRGLILSGSGNLNANQPITTSDLYLRVSGSGDMYLNGLSATSLDANISGSGRIDIISGTVDREELEIGGSGDMDFLNLVSREAEVKISGSGSAKLHATERLKVRITGSGDVYYRGNPAVDVSISGSGDLKHI